MSQPTAPQVSPLTEADPTSLSELFARDPLELSQRDLEVIVTELRAQRARYVAAQAAGQKPPRVAKAKEPLAKGLNLSLDELGL